MKNIERSAGYYNESSGIWNIGTLTSGSVVTLNLTVTVNKTGNISNFVYVNSSCNDTNSSNDKYTLNITVNKTVDLSIIKLSFSLMIKLNISSILGMILAIFIYRKV